MRRSLTTIAIIPTEKRSPTPQAGQPPKKMFTTSLSGAFWPHFYPDHQYLSTTIIIKADGESFKNHRKSCHGRRLAHSLPEKTAERKEP